MRQVALAGRKPGRARRRAWVLAGAAAAVVVGLVAYAVTGAVAGTPRLAGDRTAGMGRLAAAQGGGARSAAQAAGSPAVPPGASLPGALPVAVPHTGKGWMSTDLLVRIRKWTGGKADCRPTVRFLPDTRPGHAVPGACGAVPRLTSAAPPGYGAAQLRAYLHLTGTGAGQSVAVVDAYDNPYAARDLTIYSRRFGLPVPCGAKVKSTAGCFKFSVARPGGTGGTDPGWALESDLDVQMVHAVAPKASITLVEAYDSTLDSLLQAIHYAAALKPAPAAISDSWDGPEFAGEKAGDGYCDLARSLCVFSAGDAGNGPPNTVYSPQVYPGTAWPASDPYVLAVGGTSLELTPAGRVSLEGAWCCSDGGTGGGVSRYQPRPAYQAGVNPYRGRGTPDVSFDADPYTGVAVHDTVGLTTLSGLIQNGWFEVGGTSVGAPAWSGIIAAADQLRLAAHKAPLAGARFQAQKLIYSMPHTRGFGDITRGANNIDECNAALRTPVTACRAHQGYDLVSGWGSPRPGIDTALAGAP